VRRRLDAEMVRRGLATSLGEAREVILAGRVMVGGRPAHKTGTLVADDEAVDVSRSGRPFASRGGEKLAHALERFGIDPSGRQCLDVGASTGGFTDVLLERGAAHVVAVDVGYGQLAWHLRTDRRVTVMERTNVRDLQTQDLPYRPNLIVADLSFISLEKVIPLLARIGDAGADLVLLVKPQFEADRSDVAGGGVVVDPEIRRRAVEAVAAACHSAGVGPIDVAASPLLGPAGNVEIFLWGRNGESGRELDIEAALRQAPASRRHA